MRATTPSVIFLISASLLAIPRFASAQAADLPPAPPPPPPAPAVEPPPPAAGTTAPTTTSTGGAATTDATVPVPEPAAETGNLTGTPNPNAMGSGSDWRFSWHGYLRAPMRVGWQARPACPTGVMPGTPVNGSGMVSAAGAVGTPCAGTGVGQNGTSFHTPMLPDDQYLAWTYDRQSEKDWAEVFLNYGNDHVVGTVGLQGFGFTDAEYNHNYAAQFGISQGYVTVTPDFGIPKLKTEVKVGSFWNKYGMAGQYDAGKYDTYLFGRTHSMGEDLKGEYTVGSVRFRLEDGIGTKSEQVMVGNPIQANVAVNNSSVMEGEPGFTLLHHFHAGFSYKDVLDVNFHYLTAWSQDARVASPAYGGIDGGQETIMGAEAHVWGGMFGNLYVGYSSIDARQVEYVGPVIEVVHSMGGGGNPGGANGFFDQGYGLVDNYLGYCTQCANPQDQGTGRIQTVEAQYDLSLGLLYRKLQNPNAGFWGDGSDLTVSLFMMYNAVDTRDGTMPTQKLKYGTDVIYTPLKWFGVGLRMDNVIPNLTNDGATVNQQTEFTAVGPKLIFKSKFVTHEEITINYTHYTYWANVLPQSPYNGGTSGSGFPVY